MPYKDNTENIRCKKEYEQRCRMAWIEYKQNTPCYDCGGYFEHYLMEFDHVPSRGKKKKNIGVYGLSSITSPRVQSELAKCDLVCLMCHGRRTYFRRNS